MAGLAIFYISVLIGQKIFQVFLAPANQYKLVPLSPFSPKTHASVKGARSVNFSLETSKNTSKNGK